MLPAKDAQDRILQRISVLDPLELSVTEAHGSVLAETVTAPEDLPSSATAGADGFAVRSDDTAGADATAVSLTLIGEANAGRPFAGRVAFGEAVRVSAGAALPDGSDAVVRKEDVAVVGSSMAIGRAVRAGAEVRPAGQDVARGDPVMQEGQRIRGMDVGVLAALGRTRVRVRPRPRVVTFSTAASGAPVGDAGRDPSSYAIAGMAREAGSEVTRGGSVPGDVEVLREKFRSYLPQADVFITTGGLGDGHDSPVRSAVDKIGSLDIWPVASRPETTIAFGNVEGRLVFGLPSGPVGVILPFELFVRPALLKLAGRQTLRRPELEAFLEEGYEHQVGRESYLRVRAWRDRDGWRARLSGRQGPSVISTVAGANAFAVIPSDKAEIKPGEPVRLLLLEPLEGW
ncbi:MAG TPA: gephyrin-like molybdotransferase Glp [Actinomycetota bacterium]|jgi:molybdopterin molybdotransferase|nr:gephyrin-like molybdotransferase Glp [Actinomycetota bacterium]